MKLKSIAAEKLACEKACARVKPGDWMWHVHHETIAEPMMSAGALNRIRYIVWDKPQGEKALRLRLMRPISKAWLKTQPEILKLMGDYAEAKKTYDCVTAILTTNKIVRLLKKVYPFPPEKSPWNGRTIFPRPKK